MSPIPGVPERRAIRGPGFELEPTHGPLVMGILNVTPDSFSDGGRYFDPEVARGRALKMAHEGADIIDIGGESTRPGSLPVDEEEELRRVIPIVEGLAGRVGVPMSIDTRRARVARVALEAGCGIVNDVTACRDEDMIEVVGEYRVPVVIMHMRGEPRTMQEAPTYEDVTGEIVEFLRGRADLLTQRGIEADKIVIDPGIGFGKRFGDNLELLNAIDAFRSLGYPVMIGASRKAFLGKLLDAGPDDRLAGNLAVAARCYASGVDIVRVHDVKETVGLFRVLDAMENPGGYGVDG